jgi:hypothetical protein
LQGGADDAVRTTVARARHATTDHEEPDQRARDHARHLPGGGGARSALASGRGAPPVSVQEPRPSDPQPASRRWSRLRTMRPAVWVDAPPQAAYGRIEVIGRGGALVRSPLAMEPGSDARLDICLAGAVIRARAHVVSCRAEPGGYAVGVEFTALGEDDAALLDQLVAGDAASGLPDELAEHLDREPDPHA